jgi:SHS2 domain-containing protein
MAAADSRYRVLEHTADVGIVATGTTLSRTFEAAAEGMYSIMVELEGVREAVTREVRVVAPGRERLLVAWLLELLLLTDTEGMVFRRFEIALDGETELRARVFGEPIDPARHELGAEVKAVTRHQLRVRETPDGYEARVIFDI